MVSSFDGNFMCISNSFFHIALNVSRTMPPTVLFWKEYLIVLKDNPVAKYLKPELRRNGNIYKMYSKKSLKELLHQIQVTQETSTSLNGRIRKSFIFVKHSMALRDLKCTVPSKVDEAGANESESEPLHGSITNPFITNSISVNLSWCFQVFIKEDRGKYIIIKKNILYSPGR